MAKPSQNSNVFHGAMIRVARAKRIMADSILQKEAAPETFVQLGRKAFNWSEGLVDVFRQENPVNVNKIDCASGCSWCCRLPVFASAPELFALAAFLKESRNEAEYAEVKEQIKTAASAIEGWTIEKRLKNFVVCPLLVDDKCSVYEARPLVCRGYTSYNKDACRQKTENRDPEREIEGFLLQYLVPAYTRLGLQASVKNISIEPFDVDIIRGLSRILHDDELAAKWQAGEDVFSDIALPVEIPVELSAL
jgi:uncharacterized protein